ncbi:PepSY-associated TM helix domain-containing protein [Chitinimonas lacunae]|uniref:PepSY-associated TM helix domain-containing protein n=1 Tax=Chitinimonas lacunae TaxID=1963018 RepID=A0ABV8MNT7_9NEIS
MAVSSVISGKPPRFYAVAWRWHFYAGLLVAPIMVLLALTGLIYLYKPQLDGWMYADRLFVTPAAPLAAEQQLAAVRAAWPGATVQKFIPPPAPDRSSEFVLNTSQGPLTVFVDPATAQILGSRDETWNLQAVARRLHGTLLIGDTGDLLIELAASWGLVLLASGLYLHWPRGRGMAGVLYPRFHATGRLFWRDLHAVTAFWGALLLAFMLLSGMPWTGFWGERFAAVWSRFPAQMWNEVPKSTRKAVTLNVAGQTVPWAVEQTPLPHSTGHAHHGAALGGATRPGVGLDHLISIATRYRVAAGYSISLPGDADGVYTVSVFPNDPRQEQTLHIDQYSGAVLASISFRNYGWVPKAVELGVAFHEGKLFGWANKLLMTLACLVVLLVAVSGVLIWWLRRPYGRLGAPTASAATPPWKLGALVLLGLGLLFPLLLGSLLLIWLLDQTLGRLAFWPVLRR